MTVLDRVPVEAIAAKTPEVDWSKLLRLFVAVLALPFLLLGWSAKAVVFAALWMVSAVLAGYEAGPSAPVSKGG